jgi:hypothetical protein
MTAFALSMNSNGQRMHDALSAQWERMRGHACPAHGTLDSLPS